MSRHNKTSCGSAIIEFSAALLIVVPMILFFFDGAIIYVSSAINWNNCCEAARAAASGPPSAILADEPKKRAESVLAQRGPFAFQSSSTCQVSESITAPVPTAPLGGPVLGTVTVRTTVTIHPPFVLSLFSQKEGVTLRTEETLPFRYIVASSKQRISLPSDGDAEGLKAAAWSITMNARPLKQFIDYPNSKVNNVDVVSVFTSKSVDDSKAIKQSGTETIDNAQTSSRLELYEELYYCHNQSVGCRRYKKLDLQSGKEGTIKVVTDPDGACGDDTGYALGNSLARIMLDVSLIHGGIREIIVPAEIFDSVVDGIKNNGFQSSTDASVMGHAKRLIVGMVSNPEGYRTNVFY